MTGIPTAVYYDDTRTSWVVEYTADRQEHFGRGPLSEERARQRAAAQGLPISLQYPPPVQADPTGPIFGDKDWE